VGAANSIDLDWMLPAPAQGAIMIVCRTGDTETAKVCASLNHESTATCTKAERDFLSGLMGGCSTPISAYATIVGNKISLKGNICSTDGKKKIDIEELVNISEAATVGREAAKALLGNPEAKQLVQKFRDAEN